MVQLIGFIFAAIGTARIGQHWIRAMSDDASPHAKSVYRIFHCLLLIVALLVIVLLSFALAAAN